MVRSGLPASVFIGIQLFSAKMMVAGAPPGREVWGGVGASTGMGYIGIQLFSAKMMLAGALLGSEVWGGVGASTGMGYAGDGLYRISVTFRQILQAGAPAGSGVWRRQQDLAESN